MGRGHQFARCRIPEPADGVLMADERPLIYTIALVPLELVKNVAEIGQGVNLYATRRSRNVRR